MSESLYAVRGASLLAFDVVEGIVNSTERLHETIARRPLPLPGRGGEPRGAHGFIASGVYRAIRGVNSGVRRGVDASLRGLSRDHDSCRQPRGEIQWTGWLNGLCGDHLEATGNPLAIDMHFSTPRAELELNRDALRAALPLASGHIAVFVHGLCMSPYGWWRHDGDSIGDALHDRLGMTPVYLRYNTGRHISSNGRDLAERLSQLCEAWPVPVKSLSLVGHSMGGLVIRSGCWYAKQAKAPWLDSLSRILCLGTPHHGAALEKAGGLLDRSMQAIAYAEPLLFAKHRSLGIKDLRHGNLLDEDWEEGAVDGDGVPYTDRRRTVPLLEGVDYYLVAATLGRNRDDLWGQLFGDVLVRVGSATGKHRDRDKRLPVPPEHCRVYHEASHFDLLDDTRVLAQICEWFSEAKALPARREQDSVA